MVTLRYMTGWATEPVRSDEQYLKWLQSLSKGDEVLLQQFRPPGSSLNFPFERWEFTRSKVHPDYGTVETFDHDSHPFDRADGRITYYSGSDWGDVFCARIVPIHREIMQPGENLVISDRPIREPNYQVRSTFLVECGPEIHKACGLIRRAIKYRYEIDVHEGVLFNCYSDGNELPTIEHPSVKFLYSQTVDRR